MIYLKDPDDDGISLVWLDYGEYKVKVYDGFLNQIRKIIEEYYEIDRENFEFSELSALIGLVETFSLLHTRQSSQSYLTVSLDKYDFLLVRIDE